MLVVDDACVDCGESIPILRGEEHKHYPLTLLDSAITALLRLSLSEDRGYTVTELLSLSLCVF